MRRVPPPGSPPGRSPGRGQRGGRRGRLLPFVLVVAFVVVPLVEIWALIQVGQVIGAWWTILLLVADSILGAWLVRREGRRTWVALREALGRGRMPTRELADGALVLVGGTLLLTPGFLTDVLGFFLIAPVTRPLARRLLLRVLAHRAQRAVGLGGQAPRTPYGTGAAGRPGRVVTGEVIDPGADPRQER